MFKVGRVSAGELEEIARTVDGRAVTYTGVGGTLAGRLPTGFRHDRYEIWLPERPDSFAKSVDGLRQWAAHEGAGLTVAPAAPPEEGNTVAVATRLGPLTAVAVCRIVGVVEQPDRYGFAYGTLPGHPERGEEAFVVERQDGRVSFTITVFSKPAELLARLGGPVTRAIQRSTSRRYLQGLADFVNADS